MVLPNHALELQPLIPVPISVLMSRKAHCGLMSQQLCTPPVDAHAQGVAYCEVSQTLTHKYLSSKPCALFNSCKGA